MAWYSTPVPCREGTDRGMTGTVEHTYRELIARLSDVRRRENAVALVRGVLLATIVLAMVLVAGIGAEAIVRFPSPGRTVLFWLLSASVFLIPASFAGIRLLRFIGLVRSHPLAVVAQRVGQKYPAIADHLQNALQLHEEPAAYSSRDLVEAAFADIRQETAGVDFGRVVGWHSVVRTAKAGLGCLTLAVLFFVFVRGELLSAAQRVLHHQESFDVPARFHFLVDPGNREVVKGESVTLVIRAEGEQPAGVVLATRPTGQLEYDHQTLASENDGTFRRLLPSVRNTTDYFVQAYGVRSEEFRLTVADRPVVKLLRVYLPPPAYSHIPPGPLEDNTGDITALPGTRARIEVQSNKPLREARIVFGDSARVPMKITEFHAEAVVPVRAEGRYTLDLVDTGGVHNIDPVEYSVRVIADRNPVATILVPGANLDVTEAGTLAMVFRVSDDFGFTKLRLASRLAHSRYEQAAALFSYTEVPLPADAGVEVLQSYAWNLKPLALVPEDVVEYYIEVFDNDRVSGPKSAVSETFTLRLPSLDEVFADVEGGNNVTIETLKEALEESEEAHKDAEELRREMRKDQQKMDWQDQQRTQQLMAKYDELRRKMEEVNRTLRENVDRMQENQLLSRETMEKYQELQQLMQEVNTPEFADALKRMQQAMQQLSPELMRQALQQFQFSEENFRKGIERTLNLLKRIQVEQKLDEMTKRMEALQRQQKELEQQVTKAERPSQEMAENLARRQEDLRAQMKEIEKTLDDLRKRMEEFPAEMPLQEMAEAQKELQESGLDQQMSDISKQLQQGEFSQAAAGQQQALQKMDRLSRQLQQAREALQRQQQQQIVNEMRRALQDLVALSKKQEEMKNRSGGLEPNSQQFRQGAQNQMEALRDLGNVAERLSRVGQKSFVVSPEMGKSIGDAMRSMGQAMQSLEQRTGAGASQQQGEAMRSLNEAAQMTQGAINSMMQGGGQGMGMAGFMMRLQGLTGQQRSINQGTQSLLQEQAAGMARLAAEQTMVRKSLEQLAREAASQGELSKMLGDLNQIAREMREVQTDLVQENVRPETIRKQERIVSRLLDAQRSARERDFEKRRKAESGQNVTRSGPANLPAGGTRFRARRDILKELEGGYAREYQELIKKYFEVLESTESEQR